MNLSAIAAHANASTLEQACRSWFTKGVHIYIEDGRNGALQAWQDGLERSDADILAYFHDDLIIHETDWAQRVMKEFEDPQVGLVGFGGSCTWGDPRIYKKPYEIMQLSRGEFLSNMTDAETHGKRYQGPPIDVAVLDGFALIFRREFLERAGGWPVGKLAFHGYDFWACGMAHRLGYKIRLVPISVTHIGGQTSVSQKMDDGMNHAEGHKWIYNEFVDVLTGGVRC